LWVSLCLLSDNKQDMKSNQDKQTIQPLLPIYLIESNLSPLYHCCLGMFICYHLSESDQCNLDEKNIHLPNEIELLNDKEVMLMHGDENHYIT